MGLSNKFQEVTRMFKGCFLDVSSGCLECFNSLSRRFQENVQGVSKNCPVALNAA